MDILRKIDLFQKESNALHPMEDRIPGLIQCYYQAGLA